MLAPIEEPETSARELQEKLKHLQDTGLSGSISGRLAHTSPYHPVRLSRFVFVSFAIFSAVFTIGCLTAPLLAKGEAMVWLQIVDHAAPIRLPYLGIGSFVIAGLAFVFLSRAERIIAKDYPLLPEEQAQYELWLTELQEMNHEPESIPEVSLTPAPAPARKRSNQSALLQTPFGPPPGPCHIGPLTSDDTSPIYKGLDSIEETWLAETLLKAKQLETHYPIQVALEYSPDRDLPFALTIERATSGVINQAILEFVQFLAGIPTPPKAAISFRNLPHIDKHLSLTVVTAMDAHCGAPADVNQLESKIYIHFISPDICWKRFPYLPTHLL